MLFQAILFTCVLKFVVDGILFLQQICCTSFTLKPITLSLSEAKAERKTGGIKLKFDTKSNLAKW